MFSAIRRYSRFVTEFELAEPAEAVRRGGVVAMPLEGSFVLAANADQEDVIDILRERCGREPLLLLPSVEHFKRVFPELDLLSEHAVSLELPPHSVLCLPHPQFPKGLRIQLVEDGIVRQIVNASTVPVFAFEARDDRGETIVEPSKLARVFRGVPDMILHFPSPGEAHPLFEIKPMRAGYAYRGQLSEAIVQALTRSVLFVCIGNINRSAFAQARLGLIMAEEAEHVDGEWSYVPAYEPASAGVSASDELMVPDFMLAAAKRYGCYEAMAEHRPRLFNHEMAKAVDIVVPLAQDVKRVVEDRILENRTKIYRKRIDINDPMGGAPQAYLDMAREVELMLEQLFLKPLPEDSEL